MGYQFNTSPNTIATIACANDLIILIDIVEHIQPQLNKLRQYSNWAHIDVNITKRAVIGCPNKSKLQPLAFTTYMKAQNINFKNQQLPIFKQNELYTYFGIKMKPSLKWNIQKELTIAKIKKQSAALLFHP